MNLDQREFEFKVWTPKAIDVGAQALSKATPAELVRMVSPDVCQYILELRFRSEIWRELFNMKLREKEGEFCE